MCGITTTQFFQSHLTWASIKERLSTKEVYMINLVSGEEKNLKYVPELKEIQ